MNKKRFIVPLIAVGAGLVLLLTLLVSYLSVNHVEVLDNWSIRTDKVEYREGDDVKVTSTFDKLYSLEGITTRTLVCVSTGREQSYAPVTITSNAPAGKGITRMTEARIPLGVIDGLPKQCYYTFKSVYNLYGFQSENRSNLFTVKPKE